MASVAGLLELDRYFGPAPIDSVPGGIEPENPPILAGTRLGTIISVVWFSMMWAGTVVTFFVHYRSKIRRNAVWQAVFLAALSVRIIYLTVNLTGYSDHGQAHRVQTEDYLPSVSLHGASLSFIVSFLAYSHYGNTQANRKYGYLWTLCTGFGVIFALTMFIIDMYDKYVYLVAGNCISLVILLILGPYYMWYAREHCGDRQGEVCQPPEQLIYPQLLAVYCIWISGNIIGLILYILSFVNTSGHTVMPKHLEPLLSNDMLPLIEGLPALALLLMSNAKFFPFQLPLPRSGALNQITESYGSINNNYEESSSFSFDFEKQFSNYTIMSQLSAFSSTGSGCRVLLVKLGNSGSYVLKEWIPKNGQQFSDEELEFFQNEAELLKSHSKDCVYITGYIHHSITPMWARIFMEFFPLTLEEKINQYRVSKQFFTIQCAQVIALATLKALQYLHSRGVIHRDIKPDNVFVSWPQDSPIPYEVKVGDLGLSKTAEERTKTLTGTLPFMPPEMFKREEYGTEVDVWSFGMVLYSLLTLTSPYEEVATKDLATHIGRGKLPILPPQVHSRCGAFVPIMERCWAINGAERPTATELIGLIAQM